MNIIDYETYQETKSHYSPQFPYNTYLCSIPLDFYEVPLHWHNETEIIIIKKGCGLISVDLVLYKVHVGDIILVRPGQLHAIQQYKSESMEYENTIFQLDFLLSNSLDLCRTEFFQPFIENCFNIPSIFHKDSPCYASLSQSIRNMDILSDEKEFAYQIGIRSSLLQFFYSLFHYYANTLSTSTQNKSMEILKQILKYTEINYMHSISIQDIADYVGYSKSHFMKFFKQQMQISYISYLNDYRLTIAARHLAASSYNVLEICLLCGFDNLSYFSRQFKKKYHYSPGAYRKIHTKKCI